MRKILTSIIFIMLAYGANAQQWQYSMADAMKIAKEKDQKIILVFSGSDWCTPCIKLENDIWSTDEFKIYAKDNYVMLKADFPRKKKNKLSEDHTRINNILAEMYNPNGYFPLVVVLDSDAKVIGNLGYKKVSPKQYIELINAL